VLSPRQRAYIQAVKKVHAATGNTSLKKTLAMMKAKCLWVNGALVANWETKMRQAATATCKARKARKSAGKSTRKSSSRKSSRKSSSRKSSRKSSRRSSRRSGRK